MTLKSIHVVASGSDEDAQTFKSAAELTALQGGRLTVVSALMPPATRLAYVVPPNYYLDPALIDELEKDYLGLRQSVRARAEAAAKHAGLTIGEQVVIADFESGPWETAQRWLPLSDLVVVGPSTAKEELSADLLLHARVPVLVARPELCLKPMVVAVAWDGSMSAAHALHAALPLLAHAARVIVLQQGGAIPPDRRDAADLDAVSGYLKLHGHEVICEMASDGIDGGDAILEAAICCAADLLVCGAYGHSRLAETVLGGVTRSVLRAAFPSALLAH